MLEVKEKRIIPLKFDLMFKKVFGNELDQKPLRKLLECILEIKPKEITILNPEIIGSSYHDKRTSVDLIVEIEDGTKIGIDDKKLAETITRGDVSMEDIVKKVEDFSDDDEIIGAYDGEWHRKEVERLVRLEQIEKANEEGLASGLAKGLEQGIEQGIEKGIEQEKLNIVRNMIRENIDMNIISKVTGLSIESINSVSTNFK